MKKDLHHQAKQHRANLTLRPFGEQFIALLHTQNLQSLEARTGIAKSTLHYYLKGRLPTLPKLALVAQECDVPLSSLFCDVETKAVKQKPGAHKQTLTMVDDVMHPTIPQHSDVQFTPVDTLPKKQRWPDGLYVLTSAQGLIVRRLQWREDQQRYQLHGDNPHYASQTLQEVSPVGKVTALIHPL